MDRIQPTPQATPQGSPIAGMHGPLLVEVTTPWCGGGYLLAPIVRRVADRFRGRLRLVSVDAERHPAIRKLYDVHRIPALLFLRDGRLVDAVAGVLPENELVSRVRSVFKFGTDPRKPTDLRQSGGNDEGIDDTED